MNKLSVGTSLNFDNACEIMCPHCEHDFTEYLHKHLCDKYVGKYTTEIVVDVECPNCNGHFDVYTRIKNER